MKWDIRNWYTRFTVGLSAAANLILKVTGVLIFMVLTWYSMRYTQYTEYYNEVFVNYRDSMLKNLLVLLAAALIICVLSVLEKNLSDQVCVWVRHILLIALSIWIGVCGWLWITSVDRIPLGDQEFVLNGASYFAQGEYSFLKKGGYYDRCPQHFGLIALLELLFRLVGPYNYFTVQIISVGMTVGIGIMGYLLVRCLSDRTSVAAAYCLLMAACLPMIFYTGWVYGDIPSTFFMLMTAWCLLRYERSRRWGWLAGVAFGMMMAVLTKQNSLVMLIALGLVIGVYVLVKKDIKLLLGLVISALLTWMAYAGIQIMYQVRSGVELNRAIPAVSYIAMGMQEDTYGRCGWYTGYVNVVYWDADNDPKLAAEVSWQDIRDRLDIFENDPAYAWQFYREKVLSQWNQPLYQSLFFSSRYAGYKGGIDPDPNSIDARVHEQYREGILNFCDRIQFVLYFGLLCYFLFAVKMKSGILHHVLAVTIIGGFFFSILWEAKARYIFPYYIMMYPLAVTGIWQAASQAEKSIEWLRVRRNKDM